MRSLLRSRPLRSDFLESRPSFAGARAQGDELARYIARITLGKPGKCAEEPVLLIGLFDNSGSVTGGNDPVGLRFLENWLAITRVASRCRCGNDLIAVRHFDPPTSGDLEPTPIIRRYHTEIQESLAVPSDCNGSSCLGPALGAASALPTQYPGHRPVLVAFSDFELFDDDVDAELHKLIAFPGDKHAVVLTATPPPTLHEADDVIVTAVNHASPPGTVARAVFAALTSTRVGTKPLAPEQPPVRSRASSTSTFP